MEKTFALVDCNNFFVSCERAFNPKLIGHPTMVLSSNDGCVVARSNEVKELGIPMGIPFFEVEHIAKKHNIKIFSGNFPLYGDMSRRVMRTLRQFTPELEVYSIDEAFMRLDGRKDITNPAEYAQKIRKTILKWTGIPVSIGIAPTKTLAKLANETVKSVQNHNGLLDISTFFSDDQQPQLERFYASHEVQEVWGIGPRFAKRLHRIGVYTIADLLAQKDEWIRAQLGVTGLRTISELRGTPCIGLEHKRPAKKTITRSQSFGSSVTTLAQLKEAIASHTSQAAGKLRNQKSVAFGIIVYFSTNKHRQDQTQYNNSTLVSFPEPTNFTSDLINYAIQGLKEIYRPNYQYKRCGVTLIDISSETTRQQNLFFNDPDKKKKQKLTQVVDSMNNTAGKQLLFTAATGIHKRWRARSDLKSKRYTTKWSELPTVS